MSNTADGSGATSRTPRLGIVLLEAEHYRADFGLFEPSDREGLGRLPKGFFESPSTWPVSTAYAVARGASTVTTLHGDRSMSEGLLGAITALEPHSDFITTDCGFFYSAAPEARTKATVPMLLSGLELVDLAARLSAAPIGVLTASKPRVDEMLSTHPMAERLRILGVENQPAWEALGAEDFAEQRGWSVAALEAELLDVVQPAFAEGMLKDVGTLVLECTVFPQFRQALRSVTRIPILDTATMARTALS